jgi:DNA-binding response OmpR family regulator
LEKELSLFKVFILEDNPERMKFFRWYFVKEKYQIFHSDNVEKAKKIFEANKPFDLFLLDHDLDDRTYVNSEEENTGHQFAKFLSEKDIKNIPIIIHSINSHGAKNMNSLLKEAKWIPFHILSNGLVKKEIEIG